MNDQITLQSVEFLNHHKGTNSPSEVHVQLHTLAISFNPSTMDGSTPDEEFLGRCSEIRKEYKNLHLSVLGCQRPTPCTVHFCMMSSNFRSWSYSGPALLRRRRRATRCRCSSSSESVTFRINGSIVAGAK